MTSPRQYVSSNTGARLKQLAARLLKNLYARAYVSLNQDKIRFDPDFYLAQYPDIAASRVDPYRHYVFHGRREGRVGQSPTVENGDRIAALNPSRETVMVVSHEASRTGAPVLSLNLVMRLKARYNVIAVLLGPGELSEAFAQPGVAVVNAYGLRASADHARLFMDKVCALKPIKLAYINSVESRVVLPGLASNFVPTVSLIHEFPAYIRPKTAFLEVLYWSTEVVFSSTVIHQSAVKELPVLADRPVHILPQGRCDLSFVPEDEPTDSTEAERLEARFKALKQEGKQIVLGAGLVQLRKGVELFIDCALRVYERGGMDDLHFVWVGKGYDPERDIQYSAYLYDQILRAGLEDHVTFIPETSAIEVAYEQSAMVLITSRLDPLPNVAIDAMCFGVPVLCFERTTGLTDFLERCGVQHACVARYLHVPELADKVIGLARDDHARLALGATLRASALDVFSMDNYIQGLEDIGNAAAVRTRQEKADFDLITAAKVYRQDYIARHLVCKTDFDTLRTYVRAWASGVEKRKLFPGFHPGMYAQQCADYRPGQDPLASYLQNGRPAGVWAWDVITPDTPAAVIPAGLRIALHVHVYYVDLFEDILEGLEGNTLQPDLFLSVPDEAIKQAATIACQRYKGTVKAIEVVPNVGRDIGPFLSGFEQRHLLDYEIVGHLHTKKTKDYKDPMVGRIWYEFLLANLLGKSAPMADIIVSRLIENKQLGMVFPDDPNLVGWDSNMAFARPFMAKLGLDHLPNDIVFPVGTMFWARAECMRPLLELGLCWDDYPTEPLPFDGTMLHALERLMPMVAVAKGYTISSTNVQNITR
ncbi:rhamnan synthesis F family protein [Pseudomonas massiliensis]|uniref:rhamnan synthesis F family protein n=1 Tax=Pseudomonas massiliensis TaxID=522492 RepID=UPI000A023C3F|nr:rhamnan synthesis F family protein [Pseudomonas massiliensis]